MSEKKIERIEFVITYSCSGKCKHCSQGDHPENAKVINADDAIKAVEKITRKYNIKSLMTFGGEALLHPDTVCRIHSASRDAGIEKRQLITNGFFSRDKGYISEIANRLFECGINDLLLSVDAFHEENIPMEYVKFFAEKLQENNVSSRLNPAWLGSRDSDNFYNKRTRQIVEEFKEFGIPEGKGNIVFPKGNALKFFPEFFDGYEYDPYEDNGAVCFDPDSDFKEVFGV